MQKFYVEIGSYSNRPFVPKETPGKMGDMSAKCTYVLARMMVASHDRKQPNAVQTT